MREPKAKFDGPNSEILKSALNKHSSNTNLFSPYFAHDIMLNYVSYIKKQGPGVYVFTELRDASLLSCLTIAS